MELTINEKKKVIWFLKSIILETFIDQPPLIRWGAYDNVIDKFDILTLNEKKYLIKQLDVDASDTYKDLIIVMCLSRRNERKILLRKLKLELLFNE